MSSNDDPQAREPGTAADQTAVHDQTAVQDQTMTETVMSTPTHDQPTDQSGQVGSGQLDPGQATTVDRPTPARGVRVGTVVWGLVLAAIGVGLIAFASGVSFDVELAVILLVAAAGVALLVGSLATATRRRR